MRYLMMLIMLQLIYSQCVTADETVGRLFFTQEQRQTLDRLRAGGQHGVNIEPSVKQAALRSKGKSGNLTMQGYVKRSDIDQTTVWVNGKALQKNSRGILE